MPVEGVLADFVERARASRCSAYAGCTAPVTAYVVWQVPAEHDNPLRPPLIVERTCARHAALVMEYTHAARGVGARTVAPENLAAVLEQFLAAPVPTDDPPLVLPGAQSSGEDPTAPGVRRARALRGIGYRLVYFSVLAAVVLALRAGAPAAVAFGGVALLCLVLLTVWMASRRVSA